MAAELVRQFSFDTNAFLNGDVVDGQVDFDELFSNLPSTSVSSSDNWGQQPDNSNSLPGYEEWNQITKHALDIQHKQAQRSNSNPDSASNGKNNASEAKRSREANKTKLKDLEILAKEKVSELERLSQENTVLKFKHRILEKVVGLRNEQLRHMKEDSNPLPFNCAPRQGDGLWPNRPGPPGSGTQAELNAALQSAESQRTLLDRERFKAIGKLELINSWKEFLSEASVCLLALETSPDDPIAQHQLNEHCGNACYLFKYTSLINPDMVFNVINTHLESEEEGAPDGPDHWIPVLKTLDLTIQQQQDLVAVYHLFNKIMKGVVEERKLITAYLAKGDHLENHLVSANEVAPECQVMKRLSKALRKEKGAHLMLRGFFFGHTLNVLQFAKVAVYSYPYFPDATALITALAGQLEIPDN